MEAAQTNGIGTRLRAARQRAGLSREALAFHAGISWSAIAQIEAGRRTNLRPSTLAALARTLRVSIDYLVAGGPVDGTMLEHHALLYETDDNLASAAASFLAEALERSEAVLVVGSDTTTGLLRDQLGSQARQVQFADQLSWYCTPANALESYRQFIARAIAEGATWVRIIGEPDWAGCSEPEVRLWARYESLINLVFSAVPASILCLYDTRALDPAVIEHARATHPHTLEGEAAAPSTAYTDPGEFVLEP